ncbi:hypothetical protein ANN_03162 [Periplaneta americana]|uniref:Uncharacterized protein n=1 Tax=Periplaneta americana TaxID=6978 RepID=A0ABQ8TY90_PERAM|nr:hypothetical protein ANN_03162 [Periplaneta americana]
MRFFLWGYLKSMIFKNPSSQNIEELEEKIDHEVAEIPVDMLRHMENQTTGEEYPIAFQEVSRRAKGRGSTAQIAENKASVTLKKGQVSQNWKTIELFNMLLHHFIYSHDNVVQDRRFLEAYSRKDGYEEFLSV